MALRALQWSSWLAYLAGCLLILTHTLADYLPGGLGLFISDKGDVGESLLWRFTLYVHIIGGMICLFAVLTQFSKKLLGRFPRIHRMAGRTYALSVLVLLCPSGFYLALFAKGGILGKLGFLTLAAGALHTTLAGWRSILPRHRNLDAHRAWMTRSFALTASAVTFRIFHTIGHVAGASADANYIVSLWLSLLGNLAVAELIIRHRRHPSSLPLQLQTEP